MTELARLACFVLFAAAGARILTLREPRARRRAIQGFLAYTLLVSLAAGLTQRDAWPFSSHPIAAGLAGGDTAQTRFEFRGVDARGAEWLIHPLSWSPLFHQTLQLWFDQSFSRLSEPEKARVGAFLLARAEEARQRLRQGCRIGSERWLGPLAAPDWSTLHPRPASVSPDPYVALHVYRVAWKPREAVLDRGRTTAALVAEFR